MLLILSYYFWNLLVFVNFSDADLQVVERVDARTVFVKLAWERWTDNTLSLIRLPLQRLNRNRVKVFGLNYNCVLQVVWNCSLNCFQVWIVSLLKLRILEFEHFAFVCLVGDGLLLKVDCVLQLLELLVPFKFLYLQLKVRIDILVFIVSGLHVLSTQSMYRLSQLREVVWSKLLSALSQSLNHFFDILARLVELSIR